MEVKEDKKQNMSVYDSFDFDVMNCQRNSKLPWPLLIKTIDCKQTFSKNLTRNDDIDNDEEDLLSHHFSSSNGRIVEKNIEQNICDMVMKSRMIAAVEESSAQGDFDEEETYIDSDNNNSDDEETWSLQHIVTWEDVTDPPPLHFTERPIKPLSQHLHSGGESMLWSMYCKYITREYFNETRLALEFMLPNEKTICLVLLFLFGTEELTQFK